MNIIKKRELITALVTGYFGNWDIWNFIIFPLTLLFSRLKEPSSFNLSSWDLISHSVIISVALLLIFQVSITLSMVPAMGTFHNFAASIKPYLSFCIMSSNSLSFSLLEQFCRNNERYELYDSMCFLMFRWMVSEDLLEQ